jgi:hypothetical protein
MRETIKRHRWILIPAVLLVCIASGSAVAWRTWALSLPSPDRADREALVRWFVLREIAEEPWEIQVALVDRLEQELADGWQAPAEPGRLTAVYAARLERNIAQLKQVWFRSRVERYADCPPEQQADFLNRQLLTLEGWARLDQAPGGNGTGATKGSGSPVGVSGLFSEIERWTAQSEPGLQAKIARALRDATLFWLCTRSLQNEPPGIRLELARKIAAELDRESADDDRFENGYLQPAARQAVLRANALLLLEAWLLDQSRTLDSLPREERIAFVDRQLDRIESWRILDWFVSATEPAAASKTAGPIVLLEFAGQCIQRAEPEDRPGLQRMVQLAQQRMLLRGLRNFLPGLAR